MADADDLAGWLERHGLGALAAKLRAHDLDLGLLPHLTADDLKEAGLSLGQRRRLMLALRSDGAEPTPERRAERRRLSVLFVDLVGSTALAARLDPEETRAVMRAFQNMAAGEIARYQGHLAKFLGDGVLAYFGWPNAHEDDAERAVRAALAIAAEATRLRAPGGEPLVVRAGIATGPVVVEDGSGSGAESETGIAGETPNLAARLQTVAQPGQVVVADATRRLVAGLFELTDLGRHALKGYAEAQPAFAVGGLCTAPTRFEARQADRAPAAMVGRDLEAARLASAWERALAGCGSLVLLSGEAGIGKSRLVSSLEQRLDRPAQLRLRYQCSPFHTNTALWPVMEQISRAAALQASTDGAENIRRLEQLLGQAVAEPQADVELIAHLLGLAREDGPAGMLPPAERKRRLFRSLLAQLDGLAAQRPTLVVLEDAHWIDPTTSELFGLLLPAIDRKPVLVVITYRPEFDPPWRHLGHSTELRLSPLSAIAASVIVSELAPGLSPSLVESIVAKADGVPLFIEEVTRSITESVATGSSQAMLAVPASLHDTLMARLDRLGAARRVAQVGSVIGRAFDHRLLAACIDLPENRLGPALDDLAASGLVSRRGAGTDSSYLFKHALVRDAAYQSLLHSQRRELHARIAHHLAQRNDATAPELLAHHLTAAGQSEPAIQAWRLAAERAVRRSANREAVRHLEQALRLVDERESEVELAIRLQQAVPLIAVHGFGSDEVAGCAARTLELAEASGDGAQRFAALRITWNSGLMREPLPRVLDLAHNLMRQAAGDGARLAIAHRALGYTLCMSGRHAEALPVFDRGIALADKLPEASFSLFGEHPGIVCRFYSAWNLALMGETQSSEKRGDKAIVLARAAGNPHGLAWALVCAGVAAMFRSDVPRALALQREALAISETYGLPQWVGFSTNYRGWALHAAGEREAGLSDLTAGYEAVRRTGAVLNTTLLLWGRADRRLADGDVAGAAADVATALAHADSHGEGVVLPGLLTLAGDIALANGADPCPWWNRATATASNQGSVAWLERLDQRRAGHGARPSARREDCDGTGH